MIKKIVFLSTLTLGTFGLVGCAANDEDNAVSADEVTELTYNDDNESIEKITEEEVITAKSQWAEGIISIGEASLSSIEEATEQAENILDTMYGFDYGSVIFKPTKASEEPFRYTRDMALSYFVGGDITEDQGFALAPWTAIDFDNHETIIDLDSAISSGIYYFTSGADEERVRVEYTFGFFRDSEGNLRINLHHSSLPFA